jgi:hypothetical protein
MPGRSSCCDSSGGIPAVRIRRRGGRDETRWEWAAWRILEESGVHVRRWREDGEAYAYTMSGRPVIDAPWPRSAEEFAVLCHEVAHHALGHTAWPEWATVRRELEEEREAWEFTFACFARFGLAVPSAVSRRVAESMAERLAAALEEGLDPVPPRFQPFEAAARALLAVPPPPGYNESGDSDEVSSALHQGIQPP